MKTFKIWNGSHLLIFLLREHQAALKRLLFRIHFLLRFPKDFQYIKGSLSTINGITQSTESLRTCEANLQGKNRQLLILNSLTVRVLDGKATTSWPSQIHGAEAWNFSWLCQWTSILGRESIAHIRFSTRSRVCVYIYFRHLDATQEYSNFLLNH